MKNILAAFRRKNAFCLLLSSFAIVLSRTADAAWAWKGAGSDSNWSTAANWNKSASADSSGYYFRNSLEPISKYTLNYGSAVSVKYLVRVDSGTSQANPMVWTASADSYGLKSSSGNVGIGMETADGYLRIDRGTYSFPADIRVGGSYIGGFTLNNSTFTSAGNLNLRHTDTYFSASNSTVEVKILNVAVDTGNTNSAYFVDSSLTVSANSVVGYGKDSYGYLSAKDLDFSTSEALFSGGYGKAFSNAVGVVVKDGGDWSLGSMTVGKAVGSTGVFTNESGSVTLSNTLYLAVAEDSKGFYYHKGGVLSVGKYGICISANDACTEAGRAYFELSGGAVTNNAGGLVVGDRGTAGSYGEFKMTGGEYDVGPGYLYVGNMTRGVATIEGGSILTTNGVIFCNDSAYTSEHGTSSLNLNGGTLAAANIKYGSGAGSAELNFNGGTLKAIAEGDLIHANDNLTVTVGTNGGTIDNGGYSVFIWEDIGGIGALTLAGSGTNDIVAAQSGTGAFNVVEGTFSINGVDVSSHPVIVSSGARLLVKSTTNRAVVSNLTMAAGSVFDIKNYSNRTSLQATSLTLPESGTVALTFREGEFAVGDYEIVEMSGITVDAVKGKLVPSVSSENYYGWTVSENKLNLHVAALSTSAKWTGTAGDGKFSTPENWSAQIVPPSGVWLDFSAITAATTVNGDIDDAVFAGITLGSGVLSVDGNLSLNTLTNGRYIAVASTGTLNITGDAVLTGDGNWQYMFYKNEGTIDIGGNLIINTTSDKCPLLYYAKGSTGTIKVGGLVNNDEGKAFALCGNHSTDINWVIGEGGITSGGGKGFGHWESSNGTVTLKAATNFTDSAAIASKSTIKFDTGDGWTITQSGGLEDAGAYTIAGSGTFVGNANSSYTTSGNVSVTDTATLAINPGMKVTKGTISMASGTTLKVPGSGTVELQGALTLAAGAKLAFNFTETSSAPVLNKNGKTLTVNGSSVAVTVTGDVRPPNGRYTLTSGGGFTGNTLSLGEGSADWAKSLSVDTDGNIVLVVTSGVMILCL